MKVQKRYSILLFLGFFFVFQQPTEAEITLVKGVFGNSNATSSEGALRLDGTVGQDLTGKTGNMQVGFWAVAFQSTADTLDNTQPQVVSALPNQTLTVGGAAFARDLNVDPKVFNDAEEDTLTYMASSSAESVATASVSGSTLTVTPVTVGTATITLTANDGKVSSAPTTFIVTVTEPENSIPVVKNTVADQNLTAGQLAFTQDLSGVFTDSDGDSLSYTAVSSEEAIATIAISGNTLSVTPVAEGSATIVVTANDGKNGTVFTYFIVSVLGSAGQALKVAGGGFMEAPAIEERTVEMWIKLGVQEQMGIFGGGTHTGDQQFEFHVYKPNGVASVLDTYGLYFLFHSNDVVIPFDAIKEGWHYISIAWDGQDEVTIGIDGRFLLGRLFHLGWAAEQEQPFKMARVPRPDPNATTLVGKGRHSLWGQGIPEFTGEIDEVRIWDRPLTQEEIQANAGRFLSGPEPGLIAHYTFDSQNADGTIPDLSGNGKHGTLNGDAQLVVSAAPVDVGLALPVVANAIPEQALIAGGPVFTQDLNAAPPLFANPDGIVFVYQVRVSDESVVSATLSESVLTVTAVGLGSAKVTVSATDPQRGVGTATFTVTVANSVPVAVDDTVKIEVNGRINIAVLGNDSDPDGDPLEIIGLTDGGNSERVVQNSDGTVHYRANPDFSGTDSFTYSISDGRGGTATGTVVVTVASPAVAEVGADIQAGVSGDGTLSQKISVDVLPGETVTIELFGSQFAGAEGVVVTFFVDRPEAIASAEAKGSSLFVLSGGVVQDENTLVASIDNQGAVQEIGEGLKLVGAVTLTMADPFETVTLTLQSVSFEPQVSRGSPNLVFTIAPGSGVPSPDFNGDGQVDFLDFLLFAQNFGASQGDANYSPGLDLDSDGSVGFTDFIIFAQAFGKPVGGKVVRLAKPGF